ncbi:hypothetical protein [Aureimonas sp. Leaf324]|uniref:hypothetical protein n=1 Tax=Aureimonas sp. Leaf324 TaxID=1736336 RepID=UPI000AA51B75|nr:hypothetical protein [Aureimonas sp. Leaf324]
MANLTAVLRKTIDGLPNATPQLRAKVYEKARAAITRQIQSADPPLAAEVAEQRYRVLEDAIAESEAYYRGVEGAAVPLEAPGAPPPVAAPPPMAPQPEPAPVAPEPAPSYTAPEPERAPPRAPVPAFPRATPTMRSGDGAPVAPPRPQPSASGPPAAAEARPVERAAPAFERPPQPRTERPSPPVMPERAAADEAPQVGVVGPAPETDEAPARIAPPPASAPRERRSRDEARDRPDARTPTRGGLRPASPVPAPSAPPSPGAMLSGIPEADLGAPRYAPRRAASRGRSPLWTGVAVVALVGLGALGYLYLDDIRSVVLGTPQTASVPAGTAPGQTTDGGEASAPDAGATPETAAPPSGTVTDVAPATPTTTPPAPGGRQFTQRLLPDGTEVDEGPGTSAPNAFEEGTNVAAATIAPSPVPETTPAPTPATPEPSATPAPQAPASAPQVAAGTVPVGQRAVFYEERSADREGTQQTGNVVWSLDNEPPAEGRPAEPVIRAVVDVPDTSLKMTMTIRRNADTTLPASHVIEILFDTPANFAGGQIENVQRLALKPTEQARGEPLIGVAGKISDGFFIIALNDLPQAIQSNLALLRSQEWIDIPIAYTSGQRALMSIEKGIPGERVFREAIDAWASRT